VQFSERGKERQKVNPAGWPFSADMLIWHCCADHGDHYCCWGSSGVTRRMLASQPLLLDAQKGARQGQRSVLLVGNPALPLKGFDVAIAVLTMVNRVLPLDITWICQTQPTAAMVPGLATSGLRINLHISPAQVRHH